MASAPLPRRRGGGNGHGDADVAHALRGAAIAVHRLATVWSEAGAVSALLDEGRAPLSPGDSDPTRPLEWVWEGVAVPREVIVHEHLTLLNNSLGGGVLEIVTAVLLMDGLLRVRPRWGQPRALRMLTIATFFLAIKGVSEASVTTTQCCNALAEHFPNLSVTRVVELEYACMRALDYRFPCGMDYTVFADAIFSVANEAVPNPRAAPPIQTWPE